MPTWMDSAVVYEVNVRQFSSSSSLDSVTAAIPRLKSLGVDVLWLMPIYPISEDRKIAPLGSYYAVGNYQAVNPEFGTAQDLHELVTAAHAQGMKIVLDWVANHTGWDNPWITSHPEWYVHENDSLAQPILSPNGWNDVAQLDYRNSDMRAAMISAMKFWVNDFDVDGFRCDYAAGVPVDFWQDASSQLNSIKPLFMLAESESVPNELGTAFDAEYGWSVADKFNSLYNLGSGVAGLDYLVTDRLANTPTATSALLFITNHDLNSWNGTEYERLGASVKAMTVLYFTLPGIPLVYNGQEISMNHALAFFDKDPIDWSSGKTNTVLAKMIALKHQSSALATGTSRGGYQRISVGNSSVMVYVRSSSQDKVVVLANISGAAQDITIPFGGVAGNYREVLTNTLVSLPQTYRISLPAYGYRVFSTDTTGGVVVPVTAVKVAKKSVTIKVKKAYQATASLTPSFPSNPALTWSSSKPSIATVSSTGRISAKKRGIAVITVKTSNRKVSAKITVTVK